MKGMIGKWLRENTYAAVLFLVARLYLGYEWLTAGWHKIMDGFDAGGFLKNAVANPVVDKATGELIYPTYVAFLEEVALPGVGLINILIPWGEFLVGLGLILGCLTTAAAFFGVLMNLMFMFAGTVSTNPWMAMIGGDILAAGANAGKFGIDHYLLPYLHRLFDRRGRGPTGDADKIKRPRVV